MLLPCVTMKITKPKSRSMRETTVASLAELHAIVSARKDDWHSWFYRGQTDGRYRLVPKAGRPEFATKDDRRMFDRWKRHAVAFLPLLPQQLTDWDLLAVAQHHGL